MCIWIGLDDLFHGFILFDLAMKGYANLMQVECNKK